MSFDDELALEIADLVSAGDVRVLESSDDYIRLLEETYPWGGSKIDWARVPNAIGERNSDSNDVAGCRAFTLKVLRDHVLSGEVVYISDSALDISLIFSVAKLSKMVPILVQYPQHHYFMEKDAKWCLVFTHEGDMDFGFQPPR